MSSLIKKIIQRNGEIVIELPVNIPIPCSDCETIIALQIPGDICLVEGTKMLSQDTKERDCSISLGADETPNGIPIYIPMTESVETMLIECPVCKCKRELDIY